MKAAVIFWQVSQKQAARSAQHAKHFISQHAGPSQPVTGSLQQHSQQQRQHSEQQQHSQQQQQQQQQQQPRPQASSKQPAAQHAIEDEEPWRPQQAQHVQQDQPQEPSSNSLQRDDSREDVGMVGARAGRGFNPIGGAGVAAAMALDTSAAHARASFPPQVKPCHPSSSCHRFPPSPTLFSLCYHSTAQQYIMSTDRCNLNAAAS